MSALGADTEPDIIHERANKEYPPSSRLEQVLGNVRLPNPLALISHDDTNPIGSKSERDPNPLVRILPVSVLDRVGYGFAHRQADPVEIICAKPRLSGDAVGDLLHQIEKCDITPKSELDLVPFR